MTGEENTADEYGASKEEIKDIYGTVDITLSPDKNENLEDQLVDNYRKPLSLSNIAESDIKILKSLYRQLRRLRYSTESIPYKISILYKNYICAIRRDDSVDCFLVKHHPREDIKKMLIVIDLETVYKKDNKILEDISIVRYGIYRIIEKNERIHRRILSKMIQNKDAFFNHIEQIQERRENYSTQLSKLEEILNILSKAEERQHIELHELKNTKNNGIYKGMQTDLNRVYGTTKIEGELENINSLKNETILLIEKIRKNKENSMLSIDELMFDNIIMFDGISRNFSELNKIHQTIKTI